MLDPEETLKDLVGQVRAEPDPSSQGLAANQLMKLLRESTSELSRIRRAAMRAMWATGWTLEDIADVFEITRSRVEQVIKEE